MCGGLRAMTPSAHAASCQRVKKLEKWQNKGKTGWKSGKKVIYYPYKLENRGDKL